MPPRPPRVAVIGAGPTGLEAALYARGLRWPVTVFDRGPVAAAATRWGHVTRFTPFGQLTSPLGRATLLAGRHALPADGDLLTATDFALHYLMPLAESKPLAAAIRTDSDVLAVGRDEPGGPFRLLVRDKAGAERYELADAVLDCTGLALDRRLGPGGLPALGELAALPHLRHGPEDVLGGQRGRYANRTVLVVGGGLSAATAVAALAELATKERETWIVWLARAGRSQPVPRVANDPSKERDRLAVRANTLATRGEGNVEFHPAAQVEEVRASGPDAVRVAATVAGVRRTWDVDRVIAAVGRQANEAPLRLVAGMANVAVLGSRGAGNPVAASAAQASIRAAFRALAGQAGLDLYAAGKAVE